MGVLPFRTSWTLWTHRGGSRTYESGLCRVATMRSVEEFWRAANSVLPPSAVFDTTRFSAMSIFRTGVPPQWEHPRNRCGGELFTRDALEGDELDDCWMHVMLACVGETLGEAALRVTGARVVNARAARRLELWFESRSDAEGLRGALAEVIQERRGSGSPPRLCLRWHDEELVARVPPTPKDSTPTVNRRSVAFFPSGASRARRGARRGCTAPRRTAHRRPSPRPRECAA